MTMTDSAIDHMLQQGHVWQARQQRVHNQTAISSGYDSLDQTLQGGWQPGNLIALSYSAEGCGELQLLLPVLATLSQQARWIIFINPPQQPYAPALQAAGIDISRLLIVHTQRAKDPVWVMEQALKSGGCSAVMGWLQGLTSKAVRRLQVAASQQSVLGFLLQQSRDHSPTGAAAYHLQLAANRNHTTLTLLKRRYGWPMPAQALSLPQHRLLPDQRPGLHAVS